MLSDLFTAAHRLENENNCLRIEKNILKQRLDFSQERIKKLESQAKQAEIIFESVTSAIDFLDILAWVFKKSIRDGEENNLINGFNKYAENCHKDSLWVELRLVDGKYKLVFRNK